MNGVSFTMHGSLLQSAGGLSSTKGHPSSESLTCLSHFTQRRAFSCLWAQTESSALVGLKAGPSAWIHAICPPGAPCQPCLQTLGSASLRDHVSQSLIIKTYTRPSFLFPWRALTSTVATWIPRVNVVSIGRAQKSGSRPSLRPGRVAGPRESVRGAVTGRFLSPKVCLSLSGWS